MRKRVRWGFISFLFLSSRGEPDFWRLNQTSPQLLCLACPGYTVIKSILINPTPVEYPYEAMRSAIHVLSDWKVELPIPRKVFRYIGVTNNWMTDSTGG